MGVGLVVLAWVIDTGHPDVFARVKLRVAAGLAVLGVLLIAILGRSMIRGWSVVDAVAGLYGLWSLAAFVAAPDPGQQWSGERYQFQGLASVLVYLALYATARTLVETSEDGADITWWIVAAATVPAVYGILQWVGLDPVWDTLLDNRIFSTIGNPNTLGSVLVVGLPLGFGSFVWGSGRVRWVGGAATLIILAAIVGTSSRGAFIGGAAAGVAMVVGAVVWRPPTRVRWGWLVGVVIVGGLAAVAYGPVRSELTGAVDRMTTALDSQDDSRRFHLDGWRVTLVMIADHPLFGVGHERFPDEFPAYRNRVLDAEGIARFSPYRLESPHNGPLAIAVGAGLPALALYLGLVSGSLATLWASAWHPGTKVALTGAVTGHLVTSMFVTADLTSSSMFWMLLGAAASAAARPGVSRGADGQVGESPEHGSGASDSGFVGSA